MTTRAVGLRARAITMASVTAAFTITALVLQGTGAPPDFAETLLVSSFALLGLIMALRVPDNNLGWFYLALAILNSFASMTSSLMYMARDVWDMPNLAKAMAVASSWEWFAFVGGIVTFALLLFPDGHLLSPRWRWLARVAAGSIVLGCLLLIAMTLSDLELAVTDADADTVGPLWLNIGLGIAWFLVLVSALASLASLVMRWRRGRGIERQQMKWFLFGALLQMLGIACGFFDSQLINALGEASILTLPAAATIAITRFRLYDIDRIISRTLGWGLISVVLGIVYVACVTAITAVTAPVAGDSPIAVAAATLAAAAAFGPARRRIQTAVDHRFDRARYNAARTAEDYRSRLRDQLDLTSIGDDLVSTARAAVQPRHVLLWLRDSGGAL